MSQWVDYMKIGYFHYGVYMSKWVVYISEKEGFNKDSQMHPAENCFVDHVNGIIQIRNDDDITIWGFEPNSEIGDAVYKGFVRSEEELIGYKMFTKVWITSEMTISIPTEFLKRSKFKTLEWYIKEYKRYIGHQYPSDIKSITSSTIDMMIRLHSYRHRGLDEPSVPVYKTIDILKEALGSINFTMDDV